MIPYGKQHLDQQDIDAVVEVLRSDYLTQGPRVPAFEQGIADYCGAQFGVAVNSGTSALHIACLGLGIGEGDSVWVPAISFVASANCARYCGAHVDFIDIDSHTGNLSLQALESKLYQAQQQSQLPKAIVVVHFAGKSCDMAAISALCKPLGIAIIEDASHALGAESAHGKVGNCFFSDCTVFSFHPVKPITTAEGGMVMCNSPALAKQLRRLRQHGITKETEDFVAKDAPQWHYEQQVLGFNYRMPDLQAALGLSQLSKLDNFIQRRRTLAQRYQSNLAHSEIDFLQTESLQADGWHLFVILLPGSLDKAKLHNALRQQGIATQVHYQPICNQPYYRELGCQPELYPNAQQFYQRALSLPLYPELTENDVDLICQKLQELSVCA